jgi:hypothetical protein
MQVNFEVKTLTNKLGSIDSVTVRFVHTVTNDKSVTNLQIRSQIDSVTKLKKDQSKEYLFESSSH